MKEKIFDADKTFKEIIVENFQKLAKDINLKFSHLQKGETQRNLFPNL